MNEWSSNGSAQKEQFGRWLAYGICQAINSSSFAASSTTHLLSTMTTTTTTVADDKKRVSKASRSASTPLPKWKWTTTTAAARTPTDVMLLPISATSVLVSWTCCPTSNQQQVDNVESVAFLLTAAFQTYDIIYTSDDRLPKSLWQTTSASCSQSGGFLIEGLHTDRDYSACVVLSSFDRRRSITTNANCDRIYLNKRWVFCV